MRLLPTLVSVFLTLALHADPTPKWKLIGPTAYSTAVGQNPAGLGVFRTVEADAKRVLIGGLTSGIWLSTDRGIHWRDTTLGMPLEAVNKIRFCPSDHTRLYAATDAGIIRSDNSGNSWKFTSLNRSSTYPHMYRSDWVWLAVSPCNPDCVVASTGDGLVRTINGGKSWKQVHKNFRC